MLDCKDMILHPLAPLPRHAHSCIKCLGKGLRLCVAAHHIMQHMCPCMTKDEPAALHIALQWVTKHKQSASSKRSATYRSLDTLACKQYTQLCSKQESKRGLCDVAARIRALLCRAGSGSNLAQFCCLLQDKQSYAVTTQSAKMPKRHHSRRPPPAMHVHNPAAHQYCLSGPISSRMVML